MSYIIYSETTLRENSLSFTAVTYKNGDKFLFSELLMCMLLLPQVVAFFASTEGGATTQPSTPAPQMDIHGSPTLPGDSDGGTFIHDDSYDLVNGKQLHGKVYKRSLEAGLNCSKMRKRGVITGRIAERLGIVRRRWC